MTTKRKSHTQPPRAPKFVWCCVGTDGNKVFGNTKRDAIHFADDELGLDYSVCKYQLVSTKRGPAA